VKLSPRFTVVLFCIVGGIFFSVGSANAKESIYDGTELNQDKKPTPIIMAKERFQEDLEQLFSLDIGDYVKKPDGSIFDVDFKDMKAKINMYVFWDYIKMIPEAVMKVFFGKMLETIDVILSGFNILLVSFLELINFWQATTYNMLGIEWQFTDGAYSEGDHIYYRLVEIYVPEGESASIMQFIHYIYGFMIGLILMLLGIKIADIILGMFGFDIPLI